MRLDLREKLESRWNRLTLRRQLVICLWLCTIPISVAGSGLVLRRAYEHAQQAARETMAFQLATLDQVMNDWLGDQQAWLEQLSEGPSLRSLNPTSSAELLQQAQEAFPNIDLSVYRSDGNLIASNATPPPGSTPQDAINRRNSAWFKKTLQGDQTVELWQPNSNHSAVCLGQAAPIRKDNISIGVLQACTPPEYMAQRSGIGALAKRNDSRGSYQWLDLDQGIKQGWGILMLSRRGQLLLLHKQGAAVSGQGTLTNPNSIKRSNWATLAKAIQDLHTDPNRSTQSEFGDYLIAALPLQSNFRLASVVDTDTALGQIRRAVTGIAAVNLLVLLISSLAIWRVSKPLLKPIDNAGDALRQISEGNFEIHLPRSANNDIGRLFHYIESSAERFKEYVAETTRNAINNAQISEAKRLQADFLIEQLPETDYLEIAALCQPAYDIGADWYDAIELGDARVVVVADVCDKGIPSALYMSVFRSLLRLSLIKEWESSGDCAASVGAAVSAVNQYMAATHGRSGMFATAFVGVYDPSLEQLSYVIAGHEPPLLRHRQHGQNPEVPEPVSALNLSGPALGLFPGANFEIHSCRLAPGDLLLAFSDGLPDSRNPAGESFGKQRIEALLADVGTQQCTARGLLECVRQAVEQHCSGAEAFDDLTLLALKRRESP
jgi:serine phosphatase RsbU (regulator of sigma subunit)